LLAHLVWVHFSFYNFTFGQSVLVMKQIEHVTKRLELVAIIASSIELVTNGFLAVCSNPNQHVSQVFQSEC